MQAAVELWLEALGLRAGIPLLVRTLPLDRVLTLLSLPSRGPTAVERTPTSPARSIRERLERSIPERLERSIPERLARVEVLTDRITRELRLTRTACLQRALLRYALLRREGLGRVGFFIGVRPAPGSDGFEAHAWVCLDDAPVMEREPPNYRPTFVWPPVAAPARR